MDKSTVMHGVREGFRNDRYLENLVFLFENAHHYYSFSFIAGDTILVIGRVGVDRRHIIK